MDITEKLIKAAIDGYNICLTGGAGVGKTYNTNIIITELSKLGKRVARTASTGFAATHINGTTVHSFTGLKNGQYPYDYNRLRRYLSNKVKMKIMEIDVLVIDEASMISSWQFDLIDRLLSYIRRCEAPFGGIKVILVGDFFQLPPVIIPEDLKEKAENGEHWIFNSTAFEQGDFKVFALTEVKRQDDPVFVSLLNQARLGYLTEESRRILRRRKGEGDKEAVQIYASNRQVDAANAIYLKSLETPLEEFKASITFLDGVFTPKERKQYYFAITKSVPVKEKLQLKSGCRIMIRDNNEEEGYVNGSTGYYAYTTCVYNIHGRNYESMPEHIENLDKFEENVHYRIPRDEKHGLPLGVLEIKPEYVEEISDALANFYGGHYNNMSQMPKLKIKLDSGRRVYVGIKTWEFSFLQDTDEQGNIVQDSFFHQYPVSVAKAITAHKSQGCTIEKVFIDFKGMKQPGQAYVALSRATSLEGLYIENFDSRCVKADPFVLDFYKQQGIDLE